MKPAWRAITEVPATVSPDARIDLVRPQDRVGRRVATLVDTPARFAAFLAGLASTHPRTLGLDTETANIERGGLYRESPSLLQLAFRCPDGDVRVGVIDLLAIRDVRTLQPHLVQPTAVVFAHNYAYDERMLLRLGLRPRLVYDTCRAAKVLYEGASRLADLSARMLDTPMDKELQGSDWGRRPLSRAQIAYAARDAADTLVIGEMARPLLPDIPAPRLVLPPSARAAYQGLLDWRADVAAVTRHFPEDVVPQRTLREIAVRRPLTPDELRRIPGIGEKRLACYGAGILTTLVTVELAALVAGTPHSDVRIGASMLTNDGLHVRLSRPDHAPAAFADALPECVQRAMRNAQPWRLLRPALAGLRLTCAVAPSRDSASGRSDGGRIIPLFDRVSG